MDKVDFYLYDLKTKFNKINPNEYYLSYSGGKDSHLLYWFIKEYAKIDGIKIVGINTYMEHKEIRERIYKQNAIRNGKEPSKTIKDKINGTYKTGYNISKKAREYVTSGQAHKITHLCCHYLKKEPARIFEKENNLKPILGVRAGESTMRKRQYNSCFTKDKKFTPIWDLSNEMLDAIYKKYNIEIPKVYEYICRTGCMGCPYGSYKHDTEKELALLSKKQKDFVCEYFKESYEVLGIKV